MRSQKRASERRELADDIHAEAREMWRCGRSDRVSGLPMSVTFRMNPYYRTAYEGERRKEVRPHDDKH